MQNRGLLKYKIHHLLFWALLFGVWFFLRVDDYSNEKKALVVTAIKVVELAMMIYFTNYVLVPRLLYKKRYLLFAVLFVGVIFFSTVIKMNILGHLLNNYQLLHWTKYPKQSLYDNIIPHFFLVIAGAAIKLILDYGQLQQRMAETAKEKAEAELSFLKSQINPHFVFNSLNAIYFLIQKENNDARRALHKFSDMLRYQLYEVKDDAIPIEKEVQYLRDYVDLQLIRKDEKYTVQFSCAPDAGGFSIEPLLLLPFVENAFKHISHSADRPNFVKLDMFLVGRNFVFRISNSTEEQPATEQPGGIGLANVRRRLDLLYPGKHELKINDSENLFTVQLNLQVL